MTKFQEQLLAFISMALLAGAAIAFIVLLAVGVIPETAPWNNTDTALVPTAQVVTASEPPPTPTLLGGEGRRACGLYWESYEWVVKDERGTPAYAWLGVGDDTVYWFTNESKEKGGLLTLQDGCVLFESSSFLRKDTHRDFDVHQFRTKELNESSLELYHWGEQERIYEEPRP